MSLVRIFSEGSLLKEYPVGITAEEIQRQWPNTVLVQQKSEGLLFPRGVLLSGDFLLEKIPLSIGDNLSDLHLSQKSTSFFFGTKIDA